MKSPTLTCFGSPRNLSSVAMLVALALAGAGMAGAKPAQPPDAADTAAATRAAPARSSPGPASYAPVVKKVLPSVVRVAITAKALPVSQVPEQFRRFFGDGQGDEESPGRSFGMPRQHGVGSGVIVTKDGYILTNNHVAENATDIKVILNDGREFTAKLVGRDPKTDIALLKIDAKGLPAIEVADSDAIEVGDIVLAVGNPFGIGQTVTMGMVSAKGRATLGLDYEDFIQTDAAINPGNSGGALVDSEGRLVGINTAILSRSGGNQGIGFAVPANLARHVMDGLRTEGRVVRGFMGVVIQDVTPALAKKFKLSANSGALVSDITAGSPADKAGLKSGDVILGFQGKAVRDSRQLKLKVADTAPGTKATAKVLRDGHEKNIEITLQELPDKSVAQVTPESADTETLKGVAVSDADAAARKQLGLPEDIKGAVVSQIEPASAAYEAGLREGDVIQEINRHPVTYTADAIKLSQSSTDKTTLLRVWSKGGSHYLVVDESKVS
jgi:serine protease Do